MEKVIQKLYEIESKAENIVQNASEEKKRLQKESDQRIYEFDQSVAADTKERLNQLKAEIDHSLNLERETLEMECSAQLAKMETFFHNNHTALVDKIVQRIIGGVNHVR